MRRVASSRPRRWGMDTIRGLDTLSLRGCKHSYGDAMHSCQPYDPPYEKRDRGARSPLGLERDARPLASVAAIAIRVAIAHAAPAGGFRPLPAGRVARSAGMAGPAALFLHLMTRGITGCAGMAGQRPPVLHALAGCAVLRRALRVAERGRADQQPAAAATIKSLLTMEAGSFGSCRSTADVGRSALRSQLGPTPGPA